MPVHVTPLPWDGAARDCGEIWRLTLRDCLAVCRLYSHPLGGEVRLDLDGEMSRTEAGRDGQDAACERQTSYWYDDENREPLSDLLSARPTARRTSAAGKIALSRL
jgi:hypothetical protein